MIRTILVTDSVEIRNVMWGLETCDEEIEVLKIYNIEGKMGNYAGIEVEPFSNMMIEEDTSFDYIINVNGHSDDAYGILREIVPEEKILDWHGMLKKLFDAEKRMDCLKERLAVSWQDVVKKGKVKVGDFSYNAPYVFSKSNEVECRIGKFCSFGEDIKIFLCADHGVHYNTTYPFSAFFPEYSDIKHSFTKGDVVIGNDVWVGQRAIVLSGVTIGDGCVIGAGAVVSKSVPEYSIVVGNPGKVIKTRFSEGEIARLKEMSWWEWPYEDIYWAIPLLQSNDIDGLYKYYQRYIANKIQ